MCSFRDMDNSATEPAVMALNIQCSDPLTGETRTLTCTMRPLLESTCPPDFMDTGDEEPPTDTVSRTMDPSTAPLTDEAVIEELLNWTEGVDDPLMTPPAQVCLHISLHISHFNPFPCRWRSTSLEMREGSICLSRPRIFHLRMLRKWLIWCWLVHQPENLISR